MFSSSSIETAIKTTIENLKLSQESSINRENKVFHSAVNFMELVNCNHSIHDNLYVSYQNSSYEEYLTMCQELVKQCDTNQKSLITFIVKEIIQQAGAVKSKMNEREKEFTRLKFKKIN